MAMEYTPIEKQALDMMKRTDFKNLSKTDVLSIASKLSELRPDVAKEVIAQFPEFVKLIQSSMSEYKDILGSIISSDDESIKQVYATADKELDISADSRKQFYDFAEKVHADLNEKGKKEEKSLSRGKSPAPAPALPLQISENLLPFAAVRGIIQGSPAKPGEKEKTGELVEQAERKSFNFDPSPDADNAAVGSHMHDFFRGRRAGVPVFYSRLERK